MFGGSGEDRSLRRQARSSVRTVVLWTILASLVPTFQPDLVGQSADPGGAAYLWRGRLRSHLREALTTLGDRLERPGKERLMLVGTLKLPSQASGLPFQAVWELPGRLRIETAGRVLTANGQILTGIVTHTDEALVETFLYDTAEHFFLGQSEGLGTRFLGPRFRLDDGTTADYRDGYYDVYEVIDAVRLGSQVRMQPKLYYVNSETLLLEWAAYQSNRDSSGTKVAVQFGNWRRGDGQSVPGRIVRLENGQAVFTVTVTSAITGPRQNDGLFGAP
jgi:hypothetical protein